MPHDVSTPPLLVDVAIEAKSRADHEKLVAALLKLALPEVDGTLLPGLLAVTEEVASSRRP